jgi:hypothetical protein
MWSAMKSATLTTNRAIRRIFVGAAAAPFLVLAACDLQKLREPEDSGPAAAVSVAPAIATDTAAATAAETAAATVAAPIATVAPPGAKHTGRTAKLPNGQTGAVVALTDGGTAIVPQSADGGIPGLAGFVMPTALPSGMTMPTALPTTLPSGFPTTLPSGFKMPTFPPPPAASH